MRQMWKPLPSLVFEDAVEYSIHPTDVPTKATTGKSSGPGQTRLWPDIAARTGAVLRGVERPEVFSCDPLTLLLVEAMTAEPRTSAVRFNHTERRVLVAMANRRLDRAGLIKEVGYAEATVKAAIADVVRMIRDRVEDDEINQLSKFFAFDRVAWRYSEWLKSLAERRRL